MMKWLEKSEISTVAPILDGVATRLLLAMDLSTRLDDVSRAGIQDSKRMGSSSPTRRTFSPSRSVSTTAGERDRRSSSYRASRMSYEDLQMDHFSKEKIMDKLEDARGECRILAAKLADSQADLR